MIIFKSIIIIFAIIVGIIWFTSTDMGDRLLNYINKKLKTKDNQKIIKINYSNINDQYEHIKKLYELFKSFSHRVYSPSVIKLYEEFSDFMRYRIDIHFLQADIYSKAVYENSVLLFKMAIPFMEHNSDDKEVCQNIIDIKNEIIKIIDKSIRHNEKIANTIKENQEKEQAIYTKAVEDQLREQTSKSKDRIESFVKGLNEIEAEGNK